MPAIYAQKPIPPASNPDTICRHAQMSKWRQKGFVQDSDEEEEESQLESQGSRLNGGLSGRVERVEDDINQAEQAEHTRGQLNRVDECVEGDIDSAAYSRGINTQEKSATTPTPRRSPKRPTPSPFTPKSARNRSPQPSESPDPLQASPIPKSPRTIRPLSPQQRLESPTYPRSSTVSVPQLNDGVGLAFQTAQSSNTPLRETPAKNTEEPTHASNILNEFGILPLSDNSDDDELSDPPTDLESPPPAFVEPHRRTAVKVVIPSSTALQRHLVEQRAIRDFRQRKPIQLHPYALENEYYRREVQSRGLKPVGSTLR